MSKNVASTYNRKVPLILVFVVPFVLQIFVAVGVTGWVSLSNGQKTVSELTIRLREEVTQRVTQGLRQYLESSQVVNRMNEENIRFNHLDLQDPNSITRTFWKQRFLFDRVCGSAMYFGNSEGEFTGLGLQEDENWRIGRSGKSTNGIFYRYATDNQGNATNLILKLQEYDPRVRPWYQDAVQAGKSVWSRPYPDFIRQEMKVALAQPIYDDYGKLQGVIGVDCLLTSIGEFLEDIKVGNGKTFIIDRSGKLIAASTGKIPFKKHVKQVTASESESSVVAATGKFLSQSFSDLSQIKTEKQLDFYLNGQQKLIQITPFQEKFGLDWLIVVVVSEADFMGTINQNTQITILLCFAALALAIGVGIITSRWLIRPIWRTINAAHALSQGNWHSRVPESKTYELALLAKAFNHTAQQLQTFFSNLEYNANHDALTGLLNQTAFKQKLEEAIKRRDSAATISNSSKSYAYHFAVLFLDLDYFKLINDSLGHMMGDELLIEVTKRLQSCILPNDTIARFGGDEFLILLENITNIHDAIYTAERILKVCQQPFYLSDKKVFITTSIGIVLSTCESQNPLDFLRNADIALYCSKSDGKCRYRVFDAQMHAEAVNRLQLEMDLRRAIENEEFIVYYQPIIDIYINQIIGFEALVRWQHPGGDMISPAKFIPIAEETGLIVKIDAWVLHAVCCQMRIWQQLNLPQNLFVSVNFSSKQLLQPDLLEQIENIITNTGVDTYKIKIEITETILIHYHESTKTKLKQMQDLGLSLIIDDFGTGYSSLSYLHQFPFCKLKIDYSFISCLTENDRTRAIVEAMIVLAHKLEMDVVAEGVETTEQLDILHSIGCQQVQGYLFSAPVTHTQATALLTENFTKN
ncbi:diguanylate cyclase/phosphodiesterase with extracellular sensor [Calothrix sp. NIES-4071]|nr:diguanylate cyclase/phosphodiesterase with extracellular sensor [Calothrix sp. NIES-4071]BAZ58450.1 diguanylate cyclase/phosphodiesterase with extracellular sensor [Calothrix sp. NIES-4105]